MDNTRPASGASLFLTCKPVKLRAASFKPQILYQQLRLEIEDNGAYICTPPHLKLYLSLPTRGRNGNQTVLDSCIHFAIALAPDRLFADRQCNAVIVVESCLGGRWAETLSWTQLNVTLFGGTCGSG